jgi:hypothetical protein
MESTDLAVEKDDKHLFDTSRTAPVKLTEIRPGVLSQEVVRVCEERVIPGHLASMLAKLEEV